MRKPRIFTCSIGAAEDIPAAVGPPARQVAGAVHAAPPVAVRVGDEALGGQLRPVQVAAGQARAGDVQLARRRPIGTGSSPRPGRRRGCCQIGLPIGSTPRAGERRAHGAHDGRLGRAVGVDHPPAGRPAVRQIASGRPRRPTIRPPGPSPGRPSPARTAGGQGRVGDPAVDQHRGSAAPAAGVPGRRSARPRPAGPRTISASEASKLIEANSKARLRRHGAAFDLREGEVGDAGMGARPRPWACRWSRRCR